VRTDPKFILLLDGSRGWGPDEEWTIRLHQGLLALDQDARLICHRDGALHARLREARLPHYALPIAGGHDLFAAWRLRPLATDHRTVIHALGPIGRDLGSWVRRLGARARLVVSWRAHSRPQSGWASRRTLQDGPVDRFVGECANAREQLEAMGIPAEKIETVAIGIDLSALENVETDHEWRARLRLRPGELVFGGFTARPMENRETTTLLEGFREFRSRGGRARLALLDDGDRGEILQHQIHRLELDEDVILEDLGAHHVGRLRALDALAVEGSGGEARTLTMQAMAAGRPVVAARGNGLDDLVLDGETGLGFDPDAPGSLAAALIDLQTSASTRQRLGIAARNRSGAFDLRHSIEGMLAVYRSVAESREDHRS
jgi:glycosyltransferase involved in cell wall biosynthesis